MAWRNHQRDDGNNENNGNICNDVKWLANGRQSEMWQVAALVKSAAYHQY